MLAAATLARAGRLAAVLLYVEVLDELISGVPGFAAPEIQHEFGVTYGMAAGWLQVAFPLFAVLIEPPIMLLADRYPRRPFVLGGLWALAFCSLAAALAPSFGTLFLALGLWGASSGIGVSLSQATLMDVYPSRREQMMGRWVFMGSLGDLMVPALFALLALFAWGWREASLIGAGLFAIAALTLPREFPGRSGDEADGGGGADGGRIPIRAALREALRRRPLLVWLAAAALCSLLDEIFVAFGSLYLRDTLGASVSGRSLVLGCEVAGGMLGLALTDRLLRRFAPIRLLAVHAALCAAAYGLWIFAGSLAESAILAALFGSQAAALYPICKAQAYRALPERSATVVALASLFSAADLVLLPLLALVADSVGLLAVMLLLGTQPVGVLAIALARSRAE